MFWLAAEASKKVCGICNICRKALNAPQQHPSGVWTDPTGYSRGWGVSEGKEPGHSHCRHPAGKWAFLTKSLSWWRRGSWCSPRPEEPLPGSQLTSYLEMTWRIKEQIIHIKKNLLGIKLTPLVLYVTFKLFALICSLDWILISKRFVRAQYWRQ